jgi:ABC-2 type transport system permease protein
MNRSLIMPLILKDWYFQRGTLTILLVGGIVSIGLTLLGGILGVVGIFSTAMATVVLGLLLPQMTVVNERKQHNETFMMSLPVTPLEYAAAKILANVSMFLVVWLAIFFALAYEVLGSHHSGFLPPATVGAFAIFVGFITNLSFAIVVRSEKLWILTMTMTNLAYGLVWVALYRTPNLAKQAFGPVAVWSKDMLLLLGLEFLVLVVVLALGAYGQARKTSFLSS